jgi:glycosyltransferase involved in cell wall biosynthesis
MPTYNQAAYLPEAVESVLAQSWADYEFIIVNDGSTDSTYDILQGYASRYPEIKIIHQENRKLPTALNTGFTSARGEYLTWTSSDNRMCPDMLATLVGSLSQNPSAGMVYSDWDIIHDNGAPYRRVQTFDFNRSLLMRLNYINVSFLYRRACQEKIGLYDPGYIYVEDWEYWLRLSRSFKVYRVPHSLYEYRLHAGSMTGSGVVKPQKVIQATHKLQRHLMAKDLLGWVWSKVLYELLRVHKGEDPTLIIQPYFR